MRTIHNLENISDLRPLYCVNFTTCPSDYGYSSADRLRIPIFIDKAPWRTFPAPFLPINRIHKVNALTVISIEFPNMQIWIITHFFNDAVLKIIWTGCSASIEDSFLTKKTKYIIAHRHRFPFELVYAFKLPNFNLIVATFASVCRSE